jgi:hypothetical protein
MVPQRAAGERNVQVESSPGIVSIVIGIGATLLMGCLESHASGRQTACMAEQQRTLDVVEHELADAFPHLDGPAFASMSLS